MIKILVKYTNSLCSFVEVSGHANYADRGYDIVCSGVTTATYTSINLIEKVNSKCFKLDVKEAAGFLHLDLNYQGLKNQDIEFIQLIITNLIDMYEEIKRNYPECLKIEIL